MSPTNIGKDMERTVAARGRWGRRARVALAGMLGAATAATAVTVVGVSGVANAATLPTVQLSFSPATISTGTQPELKFASQGAPSGSILYLQDSADGGLQWKTVAKTTATQGTAKIAALSQGAWEARLIVTDDGKNLAVSKPATLTVTAAPAATAAPSGSGIPWLEIIVKPIWDAIVGFVLGGVFALL